MEIWRDGASGRLGDGDVFLSDLLARGLLARTNGVLRVSTGAGEAHVFVQHGAVVHVSGTLVLTDFLGQILVEQGLITQELVESSYAVQETEAAADSTRRRPIGAILAANLGVEPPAIVAAIRLQISRRLGQLAALSGAMWTTSLGGLEQVEAIAVATDGWAALAELIREHASDAELAALSDALLGHAVRLSAPLEALSALRLTAEEIDLFRYLDRPRKTHQLELVAPSRRRARTLLKTLRAVGVLDLLPAAQGVPIKDAIKNVVAPTSGAPPSRDDSVPPRSQSPAPRAATPAPTTAAAPRAASVKDTPLVREIRELATRVGKVSYYELLGVKTNATTVDIRAAYTAAAKKYHPDALGAEGVSVESVARAVLSALNDAYTTLSDVERRGKYDGNLKSGAVVVDDQAASRATGARTKYEMAMVHLRRHDYPKARDTLRAAMELHPQSGLYKGTFAWSLFVDPASERAEAILKASQMLEEAIQLTPNDAGLHYYQGRVLKERGDTSEAAQCFKRALKIEPKHKDSATELRLMIQRRKSDPKEKDKGSMLSRFLKR